jgi:hypothetical protein
MFIVLYMPDLKYFLYLLYLYALIAYVVVNGTIIRSRPIVYLTLLSRASSTLSLIFDIRVLIKHLTKDVGFCGSG